MEKTNRLVESHNLEAELDSMPEGELKSLIKEWQLTNKDNGGAMNISGIVYRGNLQFILENLEDPGLICQLKSSIEKSNKPMTKGDAMRGFWDIFKLDIRKYYNGVLGFDIVKFDEEIVKPTDGENTEQAVIRQWGDNAVTVIKALF